MTLCVHKTHRDSMPLLTIGLFNETLAESPFLSLRFVSHIQHYSNILIFIFVKTPGGGGGGGGGGGALAPSVRLLSTPLYIEY